MRLLLLILIWAFQLISSVYAVQPDQHGQGVFDCNFTSSYPKQYIAYATNHSIKIDGRLDDPAWAEVGFTDEFVDIFTDVRPRFRTRAKMRWDKDWLYVAGYLQETDVWANQTEHDSVIFKDNDFEVFIDTDGSSHFYKEFEINAINTTWDLCLNKAYKDGGYENSSRVFGKAGWDMQPPLRAATHVEGSVNNPQAGPSRYWTVEIAFPLQEVLYNTSGAFPRKGTFWRINFSRVEWRVLPVGTQFWKDPAFPNEDNWVWSPQGAIDMHLPERWGVLQFAEGPVNQTVPQAYPNWPAREVAMALYHAQKAFAEKHNGSYTADVAALAKFAPAHTLDGTCTSQLLVNVTPDGRCFWGQVRMTGSKPAACISHDRFLRVNPTGSCNSTDWSVCPSPPLLS
eukprot:jgi/Botrbrau1/14630/Bobra.0364s0014.1